jgi:two-component system chemotaxis response regulator CheY
MKRALIIDDSHIIRKSIAKVLQSLGIDILEAGDGAAGLDLLTQEKVDLVFCDINMPFKTGMELLEESVSVRKDNHIPIVMLTTEGRPEYLTLAKSLGANGWLTKPFNDAQIQQLVERFLV